MKKKNLILPLLLMCSSLASCGSDNDTEQAPKEFSKETFLTELSSFGLSGKMTAKSKGVDISIDSDVFVSSDEYYINGSANVHYFKGSSGLLSSRYVSSKNELITTPLESRGQTIKFDEAIVNPFTNKDASKVSYANKVVTFEVDSESTLEAEVLTLLGAKIKSMTITVNDDFKPVSFEMTSDSYGSGEQALTDLKYTAEFKTKSELGVPEIKAFDPQGNTELDSLFTEMAKMNYTMTCYSSLVDEGQSPTAVITATPGGAIVRNNALGTKYALIDDPNGEGFSDSVDLIEPDGGDAYLQKTSSTVFNPLTTLASHFASFKDFSTDLFSKNGSKYHLNAAYYDANKILPDCLFQMTPSYIVDGRLDIEIASEKVTFTYDFNFMRKGTFKIEVTDIGSTVFPFDLNDPNDYRELSVPSHWSDIDFEVCFDAFMLLGSDLDDFLPFTYPDGGWTYFGIFGGVDIEKEFDTEEDAQNFFDDYAWDLTALMFSGWDVDDSTPYDTICTNSELAIKIEVSIEEFFGSYTFKIMVTPIEE